jgi:PAS domain S-box-containing protein
MASPKLKRDRGPWNARIIPDYSVAIDINRRFLEVSDSFCKLLGYRREELLNQRVDNVTAPGTNDVGIVFDLLLRMGYMHGVWILLNRARNTRLIVRYEARLLENSRIECTMELLGAGA